MYECSVCGKRFESRGKLGPHKKSHSNGNIVSQSRLKELYHGRNMTYAEIADELGCATSTVSTYMDKHNIQPRSKRESLVKYTKLWDKDWLVREYVDKGRTAVDIAEEIDCSPTTVLRPIHHFGIETHSTGYGRKGAGAHYGINKDGYERWVANYWDGEKNHTERFFVHRLLAISKFGSEAVKDMVVHHRNEIPWDNRPENIQLMEHGEHTAHHKSNS